MTTFSLEMCHLYVVAKARGKGPREAKAASYRSVGGRWHTFCPYTLPYAQLPQFELSSLAPSLAQKLHPLGISCYYLELIILMHLNEI
jgi:hypothetical protein